VWITPDPVDPEQEAIKKGVIRVTSLTLFEAQPCGGESDLEIVQGAWDFGRINLQYIRHMKLLDDLPTLAPKEKRAMTAFRRWATAERKAWLAAISHDPLLPLPLLPPGYRGRIAWSRRRHVLQQAVAQLRTFDASNL
jgi:hypothetical protein